MTVSILDIVTATRTIPDELAENFIKIFCFLLLNLYMIMVNYNNIIFINIQ